MGVTPGLIELNHSAVINTAPFLGGKEGRLSLELAEGRIINNQHELDQLIGLLHGSKVHFGLSCLARRDILGETADTGTIHLKNELDLSKIHPKLQSEAKAKSKASGELALQQVAAAREQLIWFKDQDHYLVIPEAGIFADTFYLKRLAEMMNEKKSREPFNFQTFFDFFHKIKTTHETKQPPSKYQVNLYRAFDQLDQDGLELFIFKVIVGNENPFKINPQLEETMEKLGFSDKADKEVFGYESLYQAESYLADKSFIQLLSYLNQQITEEARYIGKFPEFKGNLNPRDIERLIVIYNLIKAREEMKYLIGGKVDIGSPAELHKILKAFPDIATGAGNVNDLFRQLGQFGRDVFSPLTARPDVLVLYCRKTEIIKDIREKILKPLYLKRRNPAVLQNMDFMRALAVNAEVHGLQVILGDWKVSLGSGFQELPPKYADELYYYLLLLCKRVSGFRNNCEGKNCDWQDDPIIKAVNKGLVLSLRQSAGKAAVNQFQAFGSVLEDGKSIMERLMQIEELNLRAATVAHVIRENGYHEIFS